MRYPLNLRFKIAAIASQIYATDTDGNSVFYVKQKLFKLKENIEIYKDESKSQLLYTVKADRIIDFSPEFGLHDHTGAVLGSVKRFGGKSFWKATYEIKVGQGFVCTVKETNPWAKVIDGFMTEVPVLGLLSGYVFHPHYVVLDASGNELAQLDKLPAFLEGKYKIENTAISLNEASQQVFAALMMVVVLRERMRG